MLVEVALTPQVFDDHCNSDMQSWLRCIDEMSHSMFPRGAASPAIATNLQWGQWSEHVKRIADQIVDQNARWKVQGLVRQLKEIAVSRPGLPISHPTNRSGLKRLLPPIGMSRSDASF